MAKAGRPNFSRSLPGDDADDARVPALAGDDDDAGALVVQSDLGERLGLGDLERSQLHRLALAVEPVERATAICRRLVLVVEGEQAGAERGVADAAARVDARPDEIAEMVGRRRPVGGGDIEQRAQAWPAARARMTARPFFTKARLRPVSGATSATVASATRSSSRQQVGRALVTRRSLRARSDALQADEGHQHDAGGAELAEAGEVVEPVRIDDDGVRQMLGSLVVVEHDRVEAEQPVPRRGRPGSSCRNRPRRAGARRGPASARTASTLGP